MAIYVYAVIPRDFIPGPPGDDPNNPWKKLEGVEFGGPADIIDIDEFKVVVSEVDLEEFSEEELKNKLKTDLDWVKKNIERHYKIVENYNNNGAIIPFKFAVIFKTREGLAESIIKEREKFLRLLWKFKGKEEWGVKVFLNKEEAAGALRRSDEEIMAMEKEMEGARAGMRWYFKKKEEEKVESRLEESAEKKINSLAKELDKLTLGCVANSPVKRPGDNREMVLNNACLLPKDKVSDFRRKIAGLSLVLKNSGLDLEITGPWPPFNFSRM